MPRRKTALALKSLLRAIETAESFETVGAALDSYCEDCDFRIQHFGVCKIDDILVRDALYTRPLRRAPIAAADFSEELKTPVIAEALHLMRPYNLMTHAFQTADTHLFDGLRALVGGAGVDGLFIIPLTIDSTITIVIMEAPAALFEKHQSEILPDIYQIIIKIFARFPTLAKWPDEYRLTPREAQVLQLAARGLSESVIADTLAISPNTVRNHMENSKRKLEARNKSHAVSLAAHHGEIDPLSDHPRARG